jgi:hypothetical protein
MRKDFIKLLEDVQLIQNIVILVFCAIIWCLYVYLLVVPLALICRWTGVKLGIYGTYQVDGIKLSSSNKKFRKLIPWQEIKELKKIPLQPFFRFEVLLHSNEVIKIDSIEEDLSIILEELELRNIPYIDFKCL